MASQTSAEAWGGSRPRWAGKGMGFSLGAHEGGSYMLPPPNKIWGLEPGRASKGLARSRAGTLAADAAHPFSFLTPGPLGPRWLVRPRAVSRNSLESVGSVCPFPPPLHRPGPVPPPSPRWQMNGGFNEHGRGRWPGGSEDALTCREGAKGRAHAGLGLGSSQAHAASILILGER